MSAKKHRYHPEMTGDPLPDGKGKSVAKFKLAKGKHKSWLSVGFEELDDTLDNREMSIELVVFGYKNSTGFQ
ncbi:hypothetical protein [Methylomonas sp. AM2-LC]|uniref:hypothetical protein n=1 Tax=Methylomonas sp. AM2-LC TaxID=3153301 RepID=UPI003267E1DF